MAKTGIHNAQTVFTIHHVVSSGVRIVWMGSKMLAGLLLGYMTHSSADVHDVTAKKDPGKTSGQV